MTKTTGSKRTLIWMVTAFCLALIGNAAAQEVPTPLSDQEFDKVLASGDTTQWLRIQLMTDDQVKAMAKSRGVEVTLGIASDKILTYYLNGLKILTQPQAKTLAKVKASLCLDGLETLGLDAAKALLPYAGEYVPQFWYTQSLKGAGGEGLTWISGIVTFNGLDSLSDELAKTIGKMKAYEIQLNGLSELNKFQAKYLAKSDSNILQLAGIKTLTDEIAKDLSMYGGKLFMPRLDQESMDRLVKYGGELTGR